MIHTFSATFGVIYTLYRGRPPQDILHSITFLHTNYKTLDLAALKVSLTEKKCKNTLSRAALTGNWSMRRRETMLDSAMWMSLSLAVLAGPRPEKYDNSEKAV